MKKSINFQSKQSTQIYLNSGSADILLNSSMKSNVCFCFQNPIIINKNTIECFCSLCQNRFQNRSVLTQKKCFCSRFRTVSVLEQRRWFCLEKGDFRTRNILSWTLEQEPDIEVLGCYDFEFNSFRTVYEGFCQRECFDENFKQAQGLKEAAE